MVMLIGLTVQHPTQSQSHPHYAVIGSEARSLLPLFVTADQITVVRVGGLTETLKRTPIDALIAPEQWSNTLDLQAATTAHLPIVRLKRHNSVANILANLRIVSVFVGESAAGERWLHQLQDGLAAVRARYANAPRIRVLILTPEGYTEGQGALITELITIAGGLNVAAEAGIPETRQISDTQIQDYRPHIVLLVGWTAEAAHAFASNPTYQGIPAFDQGRVLPITALGKRPAALVNDVWKLAVLLHAGTSP
ncbi:MAG: ABC transporter substrate-binding protein [Anaerolineae bacterium]|nr:ABC transporter substrate-binding protein [Anaerolineae bacterium]